MPLHEEQTIKIIQADRGAIPIKWGQMPLQRKNLKENQEKRRQISGIILWLIINSKRRMSIHGWIRKKKKPWPFPNKLWLQWALCLQIPLLSFSQQDWFLNDETKERSTAYHSLQRNLQYLPNLPPTFFVFQWWRLQKSQRNWVLLKVLALWKTQRKGKQILQQRQIHRSSRLLWKSSFLVQMAWTFRRRKQLKIPLQNSFPTINRVQWKSLCR